jgi:hypothetical protein
MKFQNNCEIENYITFLINRLDQIYLFIYLKNKIKLLSLTYLKKYKIKR